MMTMPIPYARMLIELEITTWPEKNVKIGNISQILLW